MSAKDYFELFVMTLGLSWVFITLLTVLWCLASKSRNRVRLAVVAFSWCTVCAGGLNFMYLDILWRNLFFILFAVGGVAFSIFTNNILDG